MAPLRYFLARREDRELAQIIAERDGEPAPAIIAEREREDERESEADNLLDADYLDSLTPQLDDLDALLGPD